MLDCSRMHSILRMPTHSHRGSAHSSGGYESADANVWFHINVYSLVFHVWTEQYLDCKEKGYENIFPACVNLLHVALQAWRPEFSFEKPSEKARCRTLHLSSHLISQWAKSVVIHNPDALGESSASVRDRISKSKVPLLDHWVSCWKWHCCVLLAVQDYWLLFPLGSLQNTFGNCESWSSMRRFSNQFQLNSSNPSVWRMWCLRQ